MEQRNRVNDDQRVAFGRRLSDQQPVHLAMGILGGVSDDLAIGQR